MIQEYSGTREVVAELLQLLGLPPSLARGDRAIVLPVNLAVGQATKPGLNVVTRSVFDLVSLAASTVEVPPEHAALGLAEPSGGVSSFQGLLRVRSSADPPSAPVLVSVRRRGHWFYILASDAESKLAFQLLQVMVGMRLVETPPQAIPTLTIPVTR